MNDADRLRELQQDAASMIRQPAAAGGADETGTVEVRIDSAGRLGGVEIHRDWSRRLGAESIGSAVVAAIADAVTKRASAWAEDAGQPSAASLPETAPTAPARRMEAQRGSNHDRSVALHDLMAMVNGALAEADALMERLEALAQRPIVGRSGAGRVTVTVTGSQIVNIEIQLRWLQQEPIGRQIADEIEAACRQAYEIEAKLAADAAARSPHVAELRDLAHDPQELVRRLGLG